jgi:diphosphomevalonate decarboxylase
MIIQESTLENRYRLNAAILKSIRADTAGCMEWECPSNIALIKYWGKKSLQRPINPSLSFTLQAAVTRLRMEYRIKPDDGSPSLEFLLDDRPNPVFEDRLRRYLQHVSQYMPFLSILHLKISTHNTFPHSAGIASSASSFGALALALCSAEQELFNTLHSEEEFFRKASYLARLGSGSASRSVYGGWVLWGNNGEFDGSTDEAAIPVTKMVHPAFRDYRDSILVVSSLAKAVSSTEGHKLMENHPFVAARIEQSNRNLLQLSQSLIRGDLHAFVETAEQEALTLHGLMMSSPPGIILMLPDTLAILQKIRQFRRDSGIPLGFTLDAGANVHLLYPAGEIKEVQKFIGDQLRSHCEHGLVIDDRVGSGPIKIV